MSRRPLIEEPRLARNSFARDDTCNDLLRRSLRSDILPDRAKHLRRFQNSDVFSELYLPDRSWDDDRDFESKTTEYRHEKWLDKTFWDRSLDNPRVCLTGPIGCGKSTLIDYYLRCYCPYNGSQKKDFEQKLILHFDARGVRDNHESYQHFYGACQATIRTACYECSSPFSIDDTLRRRAFLTSSVQSWVQAALEELSSSRTPFRYVVVVLDNLDNSPLDVQRRLIRDVESWISLPTINVWRVYIPLWPTTLAGLQRTDISLLRGATTFRVGRVNADELLQSRMHALIDSRPIPVDDSQYSNFREFVSDIVPLIKDALQMRDFTNGDLRAELYLYDAILTSKVAEGVWRQRSESTQSYRRFEYDIISGLVSSKYQQHFYKDSVIRNVFRLGHYNLTCRDLLVGFHALQLLQTGNGHVQTWYSTLMKLGYFEENLRVVEENFRQMNVLHQTPDAKPYVSGSWDFHVHDTVVSAYSDLISNPAYVDSVAQTTPVDDVILPELTLTVADVADQFADRVDSSLRFLEFVLSEEKKFAKEIPSKSKSYAKKLGLNRYSYMAAEKYFERLKKLKKSEFRPKGVNTTWWGASEARCRAILSEGRPLI